MSAFEPPCECGHDMEWHELEWADPVEGDVWFCSPGFGVSCPCPSPRPMQ